MKLLKISEKGYLDLIIFQDKFLITRTEKEQKELLIFQKKININNPLNVSIVELHLELKTVMVMSSNLFEENHDMETQLTILVNQQMGVYQTLINAS